jgi:hypothetical protein
MGHPALLDEAKEHVASEEEEKHPLFLRMHTIASYGLLFLSLLQWPCFFLAAFKFPNDKGGNIGRIGKEIKGTWRTQSGQSCSLCCCRPSLLALL